MTISKPEATNSGGIYYFRWVEEGLRVRVERLTERSSGEMVGEVTVESDRPGEQGHIHQSRYTLTSVSSRHGVAKACQARAEDIDWDAVLELISVGVLRQHREGEPLVKIGIQPPREQSQWMLRPLILDREPNLLYGYGGTGKSYLAYFLGLLVQNGDSCLGLSPLKGNVLFLDYETCWEEGDTRIQAIKRGMGFPDDAYLEYRFCHGSLASNIQEIQRMVLETKASLVIVDSVGPAMGTDSEKWDVVANRYFDALRSLRIASLSIDHRAQDKEKEGPFGSVYKYNRCRNLWEIKRVQEPGEPHITIGLYHRKLNSGQLVKPLGFKILFDEGDGLVVFERADIKLHSELVRGMPLVDQIVAFLLREGWKNYRQIADGLETGEATVTAIVRRHEGRFVFGKQDNRVTVGVRTNEST